MKRVRSDNIVDRKSNEVVPLRLLRREIRRKSPFARKGLLWDRGRPNGSFRNRRCVKFNYVIHCPCCRFSNPPPSRKKPRRFHPDDPQMRDTRMLAVLAAAMPHGRVHRFPRGGHRDHCLPELDRSAPPFRSCSPIMRRFPSPSPSNCLLPHSCIVWFRSKANPCTRRWASRPRQRNPVHRILLFSSSYVWFPKDGRTACLCGTFNWPILRIITFLRRWRSGG